MWNWSSSLGSEKHYTSSVTAVAWVKIISRLTVNTIFLEMPLLLCFEVFGDVCQCSSVKL